MRKLHSLPDANKCSLWVFHGKWNYRFFRPRTVQWAECVERGEVWRLVGCIALPQTNHDQLCLKSEVAWFVACNCHYVNKESERAWHWEGWKRCSISVLVPNQMCVMAIWWCILVVGVKSPKIPEQLKHNCHFPLELNSNRRQNSTQLKLVI